MLEFNPYDRPDFIKLSNILNKTDLKVPEK